MTGFPFSAEPPSPESSETTGHSNAGKLFRSFFECIAFKGILILHNAGQILKVFQPFDIQVQMLQKQSRNCSSLFRLPVAMMIYGKVARSFSFFSLPFPLQWFMGKPMNNKKAHGPVPIIWLPKNFPRNGFRPPVRRRCPRSSFCMRINSDVPLSAKLQELEKLRRRKKEILRRFPGLPHICRVPVMTIFISTMAEESSS